MPDLSQSLRHAYGQLSSQDGAIEAIPPKCPAAPIDGAFTASELCMHPFDFDLAELVKNTNPRPEGKFIWQPKVDGVRGPYLHQRIVTREGGPLDCARHCQPGLNRLEQAFGEPMMFDTEYSENDGFNATIAAMRRGEGRGVCWIFDAVPMREWITDSCTTPIDVRLARLRQCILAAESPHVGMVYSWSLTADQALMKAQELWLADMEGLVGKRPGSFYQRRRSPDWLRVKQTLTHEGPIIDAIAKDGRLKSLIVRTPHGPVKVSAGWTVEYGRLVHDAWLAVDPEGSGALFAEISYQRSTGVTRSIRGAKFLRLRHDMKGRS